MKPGLWMIWPMAAIYGLFWGPRTGWEWAEATFVAWLALLPPCALGWLAAKRDAPRLPPRGPLVKQGPHR